MESEHWFVLQREYDSASDGDYCGRCGVDTRPGDAVVCDKEFFCGGCAGQNAIAAAYVLILQSFQTVNDVSMCACARE